MSNITSHLLFLSQMSESVDMVEFVDEEMCDEGCSYPGAGSNQCRLGKLWK